MNEAQQPATQKMSISDKIEDKMADMAEKAAFEAGGYPGLWKFKAWKAYEAVSSGECCK